MSRTPPSVSEAVTKRFPGSFAMSLEMAPRAFFSSGGKRKVVTHNPHRAHFRSDSMHGALYRFDHHPTTTGSTSSCAVPLSAYPMKRCQYAIMVGRCSQRWPQALNASSSLSCASGWYSALVHLRNHGRRGDRLAQRSPVAEGPLRHLRAYRVSHGFVSQSVPSSARSVSRLCAMVEEVVASRAF